MVGKRSSNEYTYTDNKKEQIAESKKKSRCYGCGESEHWDRDRPECGKSMNERI